MESNNLSTIHYTPDIITKIRRGYYSAIYFWRTKEILEKDENRKSVTMQIFQRHDSTLCGIDEVVELLKIGAGYWEGEKWVSSYDELEIQALVDGEEIKPSETVAHIIGPYHTFAHLESLYLGILARRTLVATNVRKAVSVANRKPVVFFADRFDHFLNQAGDGYAAKVGGANSVATPAQGESFDGKSSGTMPHALIALYDGDTLLATEKFHKFEGDIPLIALVDFQNDVIATSLAVAKKFGNKLWGVRLDTSYDMVDKSLEYKKLNIKNQKDLYGVNVYLVKELRKALDGAGYNYVKIVASGGFTVDKISYFEKMKTAVDVYGVGSYLLKGENDFTADIVKVEDKEVAKAGRGYKSNEKLKLIQ